MAMLVGMLGWQQLLIILAIVLVIFGGSRLAGLGKASGKAIREFKDELIGPDGEKKTAESVEAPPAESSVEMKSTPSESSPSQTDPS
ncbi:MAG: twin-arginine translocase TatA/TatE family subunit [Propionibacteriaceae bacterium]|nr:twin-arginine translocase TatA/TatE family subunit [Propionibacteriaceae bacterium]